MYLSKTDFREFLSCAKCLWLKKNDKDLYIPSLTTEFNQKLIDEGYEVEEYARQMFDDGTLVRGSNEEAALQTKKLIENKSSPIFQATFITDSGFLAKIDILIYNEYLDAWTIYEVKSSTTIKTKGDENNIYDVAFQKLVMTELGIPVEQTYIIHLNKDFKKDGNIEIFELFTTTEISELVDEKSAEVKSQAEYALAFLSDNNIDLNSCTCLYSSRRNHCSSFSVLNQEVPDYSIHDIARISSKALRGLVDSLTINISDIPDNFELSPNQRVQVDLEKSQEPNIEIENIKNTLGELEYPLIFLDYETYVSAIPKLDGFSPHQHIPFQVSIHILDSERNLDHYEYLAENIENAPVDLIRFMEKTIPENGSLISWHASFENTRNKEIAEIYPEYEEFLLNLNERTYDLEKIFKDDYRHPGFKGKTSIKKVLPILCPEFSYSELDVQSGTEAMESWHRTIFEELEESERAQIQKSLLEYCKLDTLAMVEIFKHLLAT